MRSVNDLDIWQVLPQLVYGESRCESGLDYWKGAWPNLGQVRFSRISDAEGQLFVGWCERSTNRIRVTSGVDPIPPVPLQKHGIEAMKTIRRAVAIYAETLVTESCWNVIRSHEGGNKMALGIAEPGS
jgi:hypothetical protein